MKIRKLFKFEGSHIVRNCSSDRCKFSIHGHSYEVEVMFEGSMLDQGQMLVDFGLLKKPFGDIVDSFDHAHVIWKNDLQTYKDDMVKWSARLIETPLSPSAEALSIMFLGMFQTILENIEFGNKESEDVKVSSVRVHETRTGWAEAFPEDVEMAKTKFGFESNQLVFSDDIKVDWTHDYEKLLSSQEKLKFSEPIQQTGTK